VHVAAGQSKCVSFVYTLVANGWFDVSRVTIDVLPNEVLLDVSDFNVDQARERHELRGMPYAGA